MKNLLLSTVMAAGFASFATAGMAGAIAEEAPVSAAAPVAPAASVDWSGFYAGGLVSFDSGTSESYLNNVLVNSPNLEAVTAFGAFVGYNKQVNALVFGGEIAYTTGDIAIVGFSGNDYTDRIDLKARAGYSMGRAMVYGVVGYSFADFVATSGDIHPSTGLNYGAGVDFMVTDRIFVGAEYLMRNLSGTGTLNPQNRIDANLSSVSIRVGMNF